MARKRLASSEPTVTFWGAAGTVTGSLHLLEAHGRRVLLDCGLAHAGRAVAADHNRAFPFRPRDIDAVLLSHAHLDHSGNLPNLVRQGFAGPIYCTPATRALSAVILGDAAKVHEETAGRQNGPASARSAVEPLYTGRDVFRTLLRFRAIPYDTPFEVGPGLQATLVDAGHLLGSAMIHLRLDGPPAERRLTYTGDLGRPGLPLLRPPAPVPPADLLISESTYGGVTHESAEETAGRLGAVITRTVARGGKVIVPAFSVGRTQALLYFLHQLERAGYLPDVPVYVDSPMAVRATEVFQSHPECFNEAARNLLVELPGPFGPRQVRHVETVHESIALNTEATPCVIIAAGGMCEGGRVLYHLARNLGNRRCAVVLSGFQAADTLGRRLAEGRPEVRVLGQSLQVNAEVVCLTGLSSHADHAGLRESLGPLAGQVSRVRLVHGEPERAYALAEALRPAGFGNVEIPGRGETVLV